MNKLLQALLTGMFITFILDFFLFLGLMLNYTDFYGVDLYYNILFADNQNFYIFFGLSIILGYLAVYINNKIIFAVTGVLSLLTLLTLLEDVGRSVGEAMFMTKNATVEGKKRVYNGDILYDGREHITFYDYKLNKIIKINKKDIKE